MHRCSYQDVELFIEEYIFWLEISVNDTTFVHVLDGGHQLGRVKPGAVGGVRGLVVGRQPVDEPQQVSVLGVRNDEIEAAGVLETSGSSSSAGTNTLDLGQKAAST